MVCAVSASNRCGVVAARLDLNLDRQKKGDKIVKVSIPFKERFKEPLLNGTKTWTTRSRAYGKIGDSFDAFGATFILDKVEWLELGEVGAHWREEGCNSLEDLIKTWCLIHPRIGYNPNSIYCVHIFDKETKQNE